MTANPVQKTGRTAALRGRQFQALSGLVQQRAMQFDILGEFLNLGRSRTYEIVADLREACLVGESFSLGSGANWVVPTRRGVTRYFGRSLPDWTPSPLWSIRGRAAAKARVMLGAVAVEDWSSERELLLEHNWRGAYPYDGRMVRTANRFALHAAADWLVPVWAVKVDITRSPNPEQLMTALERAAAQAESDGCNTLLWMCAGAHHPDTVHTAANRVRANLSFVAVTPAELTGHSARLRIVNRTAKGA
ncbi:hypothetical protein [Nocardia sp. bgisy118]|uniref:hypothetical protein n=1 Tax=Nocardia sp. bgisy118 TaxID=3413786 RepID=UPI003F4A3EA4